MIIKLLFIFCVVVEFGHLVAVRCDHYEFGNGRNCSLYGFKVFKSVNRGSNISPRRRAQSALIGLAARPIAGRCCQCQAVSGYTAWPIGLQCASTILTFARNDIFREDYQFSDIIDSHYKLHQYPQSWVNARTRCRHEGAQLFTPTDRKEAEFVKTLYEGDEGVHSSFNGIYLGLNAYFSKGHFASIEEQRVSDLYNIWNDGEPNNQNDNENCAVMTRTGRYSDVACDRVFPFLCVRSKAGLTWNSVCNTYDTDYKSSPGLSSCYKIHTNPKIWTDAYGTCKAEGGFLAIVKTDAEKTFLIKLFADHPSSSLRGDFWKDAILIGIHDLFVPREYEYIDGPLVPLIKYASREPNNAAPGERCGAMYRDGWFNDIWCDRPHIFACERPAVSTTPLPLKLSNSKKL